MAVLLVGALAFGGLDVDQIFLDGLVDGDFCPVLPTLVFRFDIAITEAALEMLCIERFARRAADGPGAAFAVFAPIEVEHTALRADRLAVDQNQFWVRLSVLFYDGDKLPFSVQPAILFKVDPMSVIAIHEAFDPSRSSITGRVSGAYYPLASGSLRSQVDSSRLDSKIDYIL